VEEWEVNAYRQINRIYNNTIARLSQSSGLSLPLQKGKDIALCFKLKSVVEEYEQGTHTEKQTGIIAYLADGALDVSDDGSVGIVDELDSDLSHVTGVTSAAENFVHLSELDGLILG